MSEVWKSVAGYEGMYEVSSMGRVRGLPRVVYEHSGMKKTLAGKILSAANNNGYLAVHLHKKGKGAILKVHRLVAEAFHGRCSPKKECNHINGDKKDNRAENLEWLTTSENHFHAFRTGLQGTGEKHHKCKIPADKAKEIRRIALEEKLTQKKIAEMFGVSIITVNRLKCGRARKYDVCL